MADTAAGHGNPRVVLTAFIVLFALTCVPIFLVEVPLLNDYPQHIARVYILAFRDSSQYLMEYYKPDWSFQTNLAIEAMLVPLARFLDIEIAGKIFLVLVLFSLASGTLLLHRIVHRRWSIWPFLAFFLLYNRIFLGGIVSYLLMLGLALWAFALWIVLHERRPLIRVVLSVPIALLLMLGHLGAFAAYAFMVVGYELWQHLTSQRPWYFPAVGNAIATAIQFVVAAVLFLAASETSGNAGRFRYDFAQKLTAPFNLLYNYHLVFDAICFIALIGIVLAGLLCGWVKFAKPMLGSLGVLSAAYCAMPYVMFGSHGADRRLTIAIALVAIAATDWRPKRIAWRRMLVLSMTMLLAVRIVLVGAAWKAADPIYQQYLAAIDELPAGARLAVLVAHKSSETLENPPVEFIAQYAIIRRQAFVSSTFAIPGAQPLRFNHPYDVIAARVQSVYDAAELRQLWHADPKVQIGPFQQASLGAYDYVLVIHADDFHRPFPDWLKPVFVGTDFQLFKVRATSG